METIKLIYQDVRMFNKIINAVERVRNEVTDTGFLEDMIYKRISRYIKGDSAKLKHTNIINKIIYQTISDVKNRYKREIYEPFSNFNKINESDGSEIMYEPEDVLANVESEVIAKKMTALLAQDDQRGKKILEHWLNGDTNNAYISRSLARTFGGKDNSQRIYVYRFRESCREILTAI